jgi:pimeloyl-ACP methyl ester carboxylesterase
MSYSPPSSAKPFTLNIPDQDLDDWRQLLKLSKLPPQTWEGSQEDRRYGVTHKWLSETRDYWLNTYSWRDEEKRINSFPNYRMQINGVDLHFVALFSEKKDAVPIQFLHGWPGSFIEFLPMLDLIRKQYPSAKELPYHIIVPSLPGYTLSTRPTDREFSMEESVTVLNQLMVNLGFSKYIAQGGDVGSFCARIAAQNHDECVGIQLNMMTTSDQPDESKLSDLEKTAVKSGNAWRQTGSAYAQEHATRPSTIGSVLSSNPLALLAWYVPPHISQVHRTTPFPPHPYPNLTSTPTGSARSSSNGPTPTPPSPTSSPTSRSTGSPPPSSPRCSPTASCAALPPPTSPSPSASPSSPTSCSPASGTCWRRTQTW